MTNLVAQRRQSNWPAQLLNVACLYTCAGHSGCAPSMLISPPPRVACVTCVCLVPLVLCCVVVCLQVRSVSITSLEREERALQALERDVADREKRLAAREKVLADREARTGVREREVRPASRTPALALPSQPCPVPRGESRLIWVS